MSTNQNFTRLSPGGPLLGFGSTGGNLNGGVFALATQPDGKILAGGTFTTYSPTNGTITTLGCIARFNDDGSLNDTDVPTTGATTYTWTPGGAATPSITVAPPTTTTYTVKATLAGASASASSEVTVNPLPVANAGTQTTVCSGVAAQLGAPSQAGTNYSYAWSQPTGTTGAIFSSTTVANPTVTLINTTTGPISRTYTLTVTAPTGCQSSSVVTVTVNPVPTITGVTPSSGPAGTPVMIYGTGLQAATGVNFGGMASATTPVFNGTYLTATVPVGATGNSLTVTTPCGPASTSIFTVFADLTVAAPATIQPGTYNTITVTAGTGPTTGMGTLSGDVTVTNAIVVRDGGVLQLGPYHLTGQGFFQLDAGGTLSLGSADGLATGNAGAITMTGSRSYSPDANYIYTGATNQVTGTALPARVRNLTDGTQTGAALTLSAPTSVAQVLTVASATDFNLNGKALTLLSDASGTALVVNGPAGGKVVGTTGTMQRYIDPTYNNGAGYRYYSPPVAGATVATLGTASFTPVVNPSYNTASPSVLPFPTVFRYDETRLGTLRPGLAPFDNGLLSPADLNEPLAVGAGYAVNIPATEKVNFVGTFTTGDQQLSLTRSSSPPASSSGTGWNLVGNPYPAPLNWDSVKVTDRPNLDAALYTYESTGPNAGIYFSYVNGIGGSPIVAAGKSFFVRVKQDQRNGSLTLRNRHRLTSYATPAGFARTQKLDALVELELDTELSFNGGKKGGRPPTAVYGNDYAAVYRTTANGRITSAFNPDLDAYRIMATTGLNLSIGAANPSEELAIKAIPEFTNERVPLTVRVPGAGNYVLNAFTAPLLPDKIAAFLEDIQLGSSINLSKQPTYRFSTQAASTIEGRFFLRFGPAVPLPTRSWTATSDVVLYPNPARDQATVQIPGLPGATQVEATLLNALGQVVQHQRAALPATGTRLLLDVHDVAPGVYVLRLQANSTSAVRRLVVE